MLVQLCSSDGGVSHCVTIVGSLIFDSNAMKPLPLCQASLDWCCDATTGCPQRKFHLCLRLFNFCMPIPSVTGKCISNFEKFASIISLITMMHRCPMLYNLHVLVVTHHYTQNYWMSWSLKKHVISVVQNAMVFQLLSMSVWRRPVATSWPCSTDLTSTM